MRIASIPTFHLDGEVATAFDGLCVQKNGRRYFSDLLEGPQDFLVEGNLLDEGEKQWLKDHAIEPQ